LSRLKVYLARGETRLLGLGTQRRARVDLPNRDDPLCKQLHTSCSCTRRLKLFRWRVQYCSQKSYRTRLPTGLGEFGPLALHSAPSVSSTALKAQVGGAEFHPLLLPYRLRAFKASAPPPCSQPTPSTRPAHQARPPPPSTPTPLARPRPPHSQR
jgi:hypothetical protein